MIVNSVLQIIINSSLKACIFIFIDLAVIAAIISLQTHIKGTVDTNSEQKVHPFICEQANRQLNKYLNSCDATSRFPTWCDWETSRWLVRHTLVCPWEQFWGQLNQEDSDPVSVLMESKCGRGGHVEGHTWLTGPLSCVLGWHRALACACPNSTLLPVCKSHFPYQCSLRHDAIAKSMWSFRHGLITLEQGRETSFLLWGCVCQVCSCVDETDNALPRFFLSVFVFK